MADDLEDPSTTATAKGRGELLIDLAGDSDGQNFPEDEDNISTSTPEWYSMPISRSPFRPSKITQYSRWHYWPCWTSINISTLKRRRKWWDSSRNLLAKESTSPWIVIFTVCRILASDVFQCVLAASSHQINVECLAMHWFRITCT